MENCILFVGKQGRLMLRFSVFGYCLLLLLNFFEYFSNYVNNIVLQRYFFSKKMYNCIELDRRRNNFMIYRRI